MTAELRRPSRDSYESGRGATEFTVLEQLGGADERIRSATADGWAALCPGDVDDLNVVATRYLPDERCGHVLPDSAFQHDGQITKQLIRSVTLTSLGPRPGRCCGMSDRVPAVSPSSGAGAKVDAGQSHSNPIRTVGIGSEAMPRAFGVDLAIRGEAPGVFRWARRTGRGVRRRGFDQTGVVERMPR